MHPSHTHRNTQASDGSVGACGLEHTCSNTHTDTNTISLCVFLRLPWLSIEFVIDGFCDWRCETCGVSKWATLRCLLQDNSPHWPCEYANNLSSSPAAELIMMTINGVFTAAIFSLQIQRNFLTARADSNTSLCTKRHRNKYKHVLFMAWFMLLFFASF